MDILSYNKHLLECFVQDPTADMLSKYVMSETLSPIEDYSNAINLIRSNYPVYSDTTLLIVGAYLISEWFLESNDLLEILNNQIERLSMVNQAIVYYLNAHHLRRREKSYYKNPKYLENLCKSTEIAVPFVGNFLYLAELQTDKNAVQRVLDRAIANIQKVYSEEEIRQMTFEQLTSPQSFVEEFILQTHIPYVTFESIQQRYLHVVNSEKDGFTNA